MNRFIQYLIDKPKTSTSIAGALLTLAFAPFSLWPLALISVGFLFWQLLRASSPKQAFWLVFLFSMVHQVTALHWIPMSFYMDSGIWWLAVVGGVPAVIGLALYVTLFLLPAGLSVFYLKERKVLAAASFVSLWLLGEFLRSIGSLAFPWNLMGYVWVSDVNLMQLASVGHVWLLSFLVVLSSALLALGKRGVCLSFVVVALVWSFGAYRLSSEDLAAKELPASMQVVQANVPQRTKWNPRYTSEYLGRHLGLMEGSVNPSIDVVIWPETSVIHFLDENKYLRELMVEPLNGQQKLVVGAPRREGDKASGYRYFNSLFVLNAVGDIVDVYDKTWLVPFGEYIPWREYMPKFVRDMIYRREDYQSGDGDLSLQISDITALPLICFEAVSPFLASKNAQNKDFLLVVTNDAWFDGTIGPYQHLAMVRLRSVELGLPLVRSANTGVSAMFDAYGREISRLGVNRVGVLDSVNIE